MSRAPFQSRIVIGAAASLAVASLGLVGAANAAPAARVTSCQAGVNYAENWMMNGGEYSGNPGAGNPGIQGLAGTSNGINAANQDNLVALEPTPTLGPASSTTVAYYKSYKAFTDDLGISTTTTHPGKNDIPSTVKWIGYDNESWTNTPAQERNDPSGYEQKFVTAAKNFNYKTILMPSPDLLGAANTWTWSQFENASFFTMAAQIADLFEIQVQGAEYDQHLSTPADDYPTVAAQAVAAAKSAAGTANSQLQIFLGIATSRVGGLGISGPTQLLNDFKSTYKLANGYWLNVPPQSYAGVPNFTQTTSNQYAAQFLGRVPASSSASAPLCPIG